MSSRGRANSGIDQTNMRGVKENPFLNPMEDFEEVRFYILFLAESDFIYIHIVCNIQI